MIVGLTGGIATGKSIASQYLKDKGYEVLDADKVSRWLVEVGQPALVEIEATFGASFLNEDGTLNRAQLGQHIFQDHREKDKLDAIMQPKLKAIITQWIEERRQKEGLFIVDMPLLFEFHLQSLVDEVVMITTTPLNERIRLQERNHLTKEEAMQRISSQWPLYKKEKLADVVIENNGTKEDLYQKIEEWLKPFKKCGISR